MPQVARKCDSLDEFYRFPLENFIEGGVVSFTTLDLKRVAIFKNLKLQEQIKAVLIVASANLVLKHRKRSSKKQRFTLTKKAVLIKEKYGCVVHSLVGGVTDCQAFKKYIWKVIRYYKDMSKLWNTKIGVIGRGMFGFKLSRTIFYGRHGEVQKKGRKHIKRFNIVEKVVEKKQATQIHKKIRKIRRKKKVYTSLVRRNNKWYRSKQILNCWLTQVGERGHVLFPHARKFIAKFQRRNTIYKVLGFVGTKKDSAQSNFYTTMFINMRAFGLYKIKGLKRLGEQGLSKEGKSRKY